MPVSRRAGSRRAARREGRGPRELRRAAGRQRSKHGRLHAASALGFSAEFLEDSAVSVNASASPFAIRTASGRTLLASALIVATGATSRWLGVDGEEALKGRGISGCATCDGFRYRGGRCAVIGGGDTAAEEAMVLARHCASVVVVHRRETLRASKALQRRLFAEPKVTVLYNAEVLRFRAGAGDGQLQLLELRGTSKAQPPGRFLQVDAAFVAIGRTPNVAFLDGAVRANGEGYLQVTPGSTVTSLEGVFAAGDVSDHIYRQAITSVASGAAAAADAERYLAGGTCPAACVSKGNIAGFGIHTITDFFKLCCMCTVIGKCACSY